MPEPSDEFRAANFRNWESRVPIHAASNLYDVAQYVDEPDRLSHVVAYDAPRLGRLDGLDVVHLQCHIGTDTISLARLGAKSITGLDFSPSALDVARKLAADCGIDATFVESELYDAPDALGRARFDLVYTGVGALNWLPDIAGWAKVVASLLRPGGRLFIRDCHPVLFAVDNERDDGELVVAFPYFQSAPLRWEGARTYTDGDASAVSPLLYEWNHGLSEIVTAVLDAGMVLDGLVEHRECPWQALPQMVPDGSEWVLPDRPERLPLMFSLSAHLG